MNEIKLSDGDKIIVWDNFIGKDFQNSILETLHHKNSFPWYFLNKIGHTQFDDLNYEDKKITDSIGFYHSVVDDGKIISKYYDYFRSLLFILSDKIDIQIDHILRIRLRLTTKIEGHDSNNYAAPHVDFADFKGQYYTLIYYVDDADGDTVFFNKLFDPEKEIYNPEIDLKLDPVYYIRPTKGKAVFFNGHRYHSGNYPIKHDSRIVINFDFTIKNN